MANSSKSALFLMESRYDDAIEGDDGATLYDLGVACSTGSNGSGIDLIAAHKWFNLAAVAGFLPGQIARAEIASDMTMREIAEAQRQARAFLNGMSHQLRAA
ncbi:hypothetical protein [Sphingomonas sp. Leaf21]|uniref:hypothetical protein n=1 Tax=Sphingomonas sp. Leaf21 TaxID=2876550 RepID=UPI001E354C81|nr:hypothetical protein [Sphingomonas sp. Leaf21]